MKYYKLMAAALIFAAGTVVSAQENSENKAAETEKSAEKTVQNTVVTAAPAEEKKLVLTVEDAVKYALENNKSLKSSAIDLEMKKRANDNSWNTFLPSLSVSGTAARTTENSTYETIYSTVVTQARLYALESGGAVPSAAYDSIVKNAGYEDTEDLHWAVVGNVGLSWAFNAAMVEQIKIAKTQYESGKITYEKACTEMETNIRKLFYGLLLAQENLKINKESLANTKARADQAAINYKNGLAPELQYLNLQVAYENAKPNVIKAEQSLKQNLDTFGFLLGLPYGSNIELSGSISVTPVTVDADELVKDYISSSDEIKSIKKNIEIAELGLKAKRLSIYTPSLALNYSYQPVLYAAGDWNSGSDITDNGSLSLTLAFSNVLSWLPWSSDSQGIKDIEQQIVQANLGYEQLVSNAEVEIHKLVDNLEIARVNMKSMEANVELAQKAYNSTLKGFNNGTQEWLSVRESDASLKQARLGLMNERFNYISAVLDLEQKLNMKLTKQE